MSFRGTYIGRDVIKIWTNGQDLTASGGKEEGKIKKIMDDVAFFLKILYQSWSIMNRICWQGRLPPCLLRMSSRLAPTTGAYAQYRGPGDYRIVFNAAHCRMMDDAAFLQIMAHEMIHILQYSRDGRGGHGRDFQNEQRRLGLILGRVIPQDSPMGYVLFMHLMKGLHPAEAARCIAAHPGHGRCEMEYFRSLFR